MRVAAAAICVLLFLPQGAQAECIGGPSTSFKQVVVGGFSTCGLTARGIAYCWGSDDGGRLGDGGTAGDKQSPAPVDISPITGEKVFVSLTAGDNHFCGLTSQGAAYCWGYDANGQLGDGGGSSDAYSPVRVDTSGMTGPKAFVKLTAGGNHTCGLTGDGAAYCWGDDSSGQLGDGGVSNPSQVPVAVDRTPAGGKAFVQIAAGTSHTCALTANGAVYCWGDDGYGQLGDGAGASPSQVPVAVDRSPAGNLAFVRLTAGFHHTCGLTAEGVAYCWGDDSDGQLGDGGVSPSYVPSAVDTGPTGGRPFLELTAGSNHTCGLIAGGAAYCWGADNEGSLGNGGSSTPIHIPSPVDAAAVVDKPLIQISAGASHTCGLTSEHAPYCWGGDTYGQLGDGGTSAPPAQSPVAVDTSPVSEWTAFVHLAGGDGHTCGVTGEGTAACWGEGTLGAIGDGGGIVDAQIPTPVDTSPVIGEKTFTEHAAGLSHTCGLTSEGVAYSWGWNQYGQLGDSNPGVLSHVPVAVDLSQVTGEQAFIQLTAGGTYTCGLTAAREAYCWGAGGNGALGTGVENDFPRPAAVDTSTITGEKTFTQLTTGFYHTCGLTSDAVAYCWGYNQDGQLGVGSTYLESVNPVAVDMTTIVGEQAFVQLSAGQRFTCGLTPEGKVYCWGNDTNGQLGTPGAAADSFVPVEVDTTGISGEKQFVRIASCEFRTCGLTAEGVAYCWGQGSGGCMGTGGIQERIPAPVDTTTMNGESTFLRIAHGFDQTCGITPRGRTYCWGVDERGQLGTWGPPADSAVPAAVDTCLHCQTDADCGDGLGCTTEACDHTEGEETIVISDAAFTITAQGGWTTNYANTSANGGEIIHSPDAATPLEILFTTQGSTIPYQFWVAFARVKVQNGTGCTASLTGAVDGAQFAGIASDTADDDFVWSPLGAASLTPGPHTLSLTCTATCPTRRCAVDGIVFSTVDIDPQTNPGFVPYLTAAWDDPSLDAHVSVCAYTATSCDDGLFCNGQETCVEFIGCVPGTDPCAPLSCDEANDVCGGCAVDTDCPPCDFCDVGGVCNHQTSGQDLKEDCPVTDCLTGICNGLGACETRPVGTACTDDGIYCNGPEECNAAGQCVGSGDPCPNNDCNHCNETDRNCYDPADTPCQDDGLFCTGAETCDGFGACRSAGDPCPGTECNNCDEIADSCFDPVGTPCSDDGLFCTGSEECDGLGACRSTGNPCAAPLTCDDNIDACVGCLDHADCGFCQWCNASTCEDQAAGQDLKDDCPPGDCLTGDCDGLGGCGTLPAGSACADDGVYCNGPEECDAFGFCNSTGNPCPGTTCHNCQEELANCLDPPGTPCTPDGLFCTGEEQCDGAGNCLSPGNPCDETECNHCQEDADSCFDPAGTPCRDDGLYCTGAEACDGLGSCRSSGDPCPGDQCNTCQEDTDSCFDPPGTSCDDGEYCSGVDTCDGSGTCVSTGDPCPDTECNQCNEHDDTCFDPRDTLCSECHLCDGTGGCDLDRNATDWTTACTDLETDCPGLCLSGSCAVEEVCNGADYCREMTYPEDEGHCRIPGEHVFMDVELEPTSAEVGEFVPVRVVLQNRWYKSLVRMSVILRLNPPNPDGSERAARVAYVCDSAIANGGELEQVETRVEADELVRIDLANLENGFTDPVVLDLLLLVGTGPAEDARFELSVWAPCQSTPEEVGCHPGHPDYPDDPPRSSQDWRLQQLTDAVRKDPSGATYDENDRRSGMLRSPVLGCQCGAGEPGVRPLHFALFSLLCLNFNQLRKRRSAKCKGLTPGSRRFR